MNNTVTSNNDPRNNIGSAYRVWRGPGNHPDYDWRKFIPPTWIPNPKDQYGVRLLARQRVEETNHDPIKIDEFQRVDLRGYPLRMIRKVQLVKMFRPVIEGGVASGGTYSQFGTGSPAPPTSFDSVIAGLKSGLPWGPGDLIFPYADSPGLPKELGGQSINGGGKIETYSPTIQHVLGVLNGTAIFEYALPGRYASGSMQLQTNMQPPMRTFYTSGDDLPLAGTNISTKNIANSMAGNAGDGFITGLINDAATRLSRALFHESLYFEPDSVLRHPFLDQGVLAEYLNTSPQSVYDDDERIRIDGTGHSYKYWQPNAALFERGTTIYFTEPVHPITESGSAIKKSIREAFNKAQEEKNKFAYQSATELLLSSVFEYSTYEKCIVFFVDTTDNCDFYEFAQSVLDLQYAKLLPKVHVGFVLVSSLHDFDNAALEDYMRTMCDAVPFFTFLGTWVAPVVDYSTGWKIMWDPFTMQSHQTYVNELFTNADLNAIEDFARKSFGMPKRKLDWRANGGTLESTTELALQQPAPPFTPGLAF